MNKKLKILCSSILSLILISSNLIVANAKTIGNEAQVKAIIQQYFENDFKSMKTHKPIDSGSLIANETLKRYVNTKNNLIADWYDSIGETLNNYKLYLDYDSIQFNNNTCTVELRKGSKMIFVNSPEVTQKSGGEYHKITLEKNNNKWVINKDCFDEDGNMISTIWGGGSICVTRGKVNQVRPTYMKIGYMAQLISAM